MRRACRVTFSAGSRLAPSARLVAEARSHSGTPCVPGTRRPREAGPSAGSRFVLASRPVAAQRDLEAQSIPEARCRPMVQSVPWTQLVRAARSVEETRAQRPGHRRAAGRAGRLRADHHRCRHSAGHPSGRTKGMPSARCTPPQRPFAYGKMPSVSPKRLPQSRCHRTRPDFLGICVDRQAGHRVLVLEIDQPSYWKRPATRLRKALQ